MCYPKPGPRCSAHARKALVAAHMNRIHAGRNSSQDPESYIHAKEAFAKAEDDYHMTPSGQLDLQRKIDRGEDYDGMLTLRKEHFLQKRKEALAAVGATKKGKNKISDIHKYTEKLSDVDSFTDSDFYTDDVPRPRWDDNPEMLRKKVADYIETSGRYIEKLSLEEHFALRWYTSNGSAKSYKHLVEGESLDNESAVHHAHLDAVFARHQPTAPQVVYRGLQHLEYPEGVDPYSEADEQKRLEHLRSLFPEGENIAIPHYSSTSADPGTATGFAQNDVVMEIKATRLVPAGVVSAWEASEREMILDKGRTYRVIGVKPGIPFANAHFDEKSTNFTVVQLEEVIIPSRNIQ